MITLSSKIPGMSLWTYDIARFPDKKQVYDPNTLINYTKRNANQDAVNPVTQNPTITPTQAVNIFRVICDVNHVSKGTNLLTHGIKFTTSDNIDQQVQITNYHSVQKFINAMYVDDDVYIHADTTVTRDTKNQPFTTKTQGIKIIYQTGIVQSNRGIGLVVFEVSTGYKIPTGATIKANPTIQNDYGKMVNDTPETYPVIYEMLPGIYELPITAGKYDDWLQCDIDFETVQTEPTTPTTPITPTTPVTIPLVQKLNFVKSNITGASIDRKLNAISLTADAGYTFQSSIQLLFYSGGKVVSEYNVDGNNTDNMTISLNTTKENTITDQMDNIQLTASATLATSHAGYEHNYLITDTELNSFSNDQIWNYVGGEQGEENYNVSQYINNLIELPFKVDTITNVKQISVGRVNSKVVSHETKARFITLDLGAINVPAKYNNGYDYQNKTVKLYTPFVDPITINNENAIEKTISISYKIDVSNGNLTINLYNDDVLFFTGTNNIASQLPFLNTLKNTIINRDTHFNDNDIRQPYIIVSRETPILNSAYYPTSERGLIKNYNGNIQVSLLNNMNIPNAELSELTNLLESGAKYVKND